MNAYELVNKNGEATIKLLVTINGGAAIAVLGFADGLIRGPSPVITGQALAFTMFWLIAGIVSAVLAMASMNVFLMTDGDPDWKTLNVSKKLRRPARWAAYLLAVSSLICFVLGAGTAACSLGAVVA